MNISEPNFDKYSLEELNDIYDHIDRDKYPERFQKVVKEIAKRKRYASDKKIENPEENKKLPKLYSKQAINTFSMIFSIITGVLLFIQNLHEVKKSNYVFSVFMGFIVYFSIGIIIILSWIENIFAPFILNGVGVIVINYFLWDKYIGENTKYQKKSILKPLIICILIFIVPIIIFIGW